MPTLSSSNRAQLAYKLEGTYPTNFGSLQPGNGKKLRYTGESLDYTIKTESSKEIRSDRQVTDVVQVSASPQGGFNFELSYLEYDPLLAAVMQGSWIEYGTGGVSAAITTLTLASTTVTAGAAPTGNDAFVNLSMGDWFSVIPAAGASAAVKAYFAGRAFRCSLSAAPTSTVITLDASTPIDTVIAGTSLSGAKISSAKVSNGAVMKSYSLEVGHLDIGQFRQYTGMVPSKVDLKLGVGNIITGSMDFLGKGSVMAQTTGMGSVTDSETFTPANAVKGVFDVFEGGASISATTYIKSLDVSIDNSLRAQEAVGVFGNAGLAAGTLKAGGKLEVYFADATMYNKFLNNTDSSISVPLLDKEGNGYVVVFHRIKYTASKMNAGGLDQDNMLSLDYTGLMDNDVTSASYEKTVTIYRVGQ
jgi:hypothetical protein